MRTKITNAAPPPADIYGDDDSSSAEPSTALATIDASNLSGRPDSTPSSSSEALLDERLREFRGCLDKSALSYFRACELVAQLRDRHWQQRVDAGCPRYKTFEQFAKAELGLSRQRAYEMLRVQAEGLSAVAPLIGIEAVKILASVQPENRPALIESAKAGASTRELAAAAKQLRTANAETKPRAKPLAPEINAHPDAANIRSIITKGNELTQCGPREKHGETTILKFRSQAVTDGAEILITVTIPKFRAATLTIGPSDDDE